MITIDTLIIAHIPHSHTNPYSLYLPIYLSLSHTHTHTHTHFTDHKILVLVHFPVLPAEQGTLLCGDDRGVAMNGTKTGFERL